MTPHTPGPWEVYFNGLSIADADGHLLSTDVDGVCDDEARANARLIAAAPDLLEALGAAENELLWQLERGNGTPATRAAAAITRAAIAKATGEA